MKAGVEEALAEHRQGGPIADADAPADDDLRTDSTSSRGPSLKRLALLGLLTSVAYLRRRRRRESHSETSQ